MTVAEPAPRSIPRVVDRVAPTADSQQPQPSHKRPRPPSTPSTPDTEATGTDLAELYDRLLQSGHPALATLGSMYPTLAACQSFDDVVQHSQMYLDANAVSAASVAATTFFQVNPDRRIDTAAIQADAAAARSAGLTNFLLSRMRAITDRVYQPGATIVPPTTAPQPSVPPYPTPAGLANFHALAHGAPLELPPTFQPNATLLPPKPPGYELAMERLVAEYFESGSMILLPYELAMVLCAEDGLDLHLSPTFIVRKVGADKGRAVTDYTRALLNALFKKSLLSDQYGPIVYPTHPVLCRTLLAVKAAYPAERIVLAKEDFQGWFNRIPNRVENVPRTASVLYIDGQPFVCLPLVEQFGLQDSNYHSNLGSGVIYANMRAHDFAQFNMEVAHLYSDDEIAFLPASAVAARRPRYRAVAEAVAGRGVIAERKHSAHPQNEAIGARYDCDAMTIGLSESLYIKLVCVLYNELPFDLQPQQRVNVTTMERLGAYMMLCGQFLPQLGAFCRSAHENLHRAQPRQSTVPLNLKTIIDIRLWRIAVRHAWHDPVSLVVPVHVPPLLAPLPDETALALALRQEAHAYYVQDSDACTFTVDNPCWGGGFVLWREGTACLWGGHQLPKFQHYHTCGSVPVDAHINLYELLMAIAGIAALCEQLSTLRPLPPHPQHALLHIHVWTDNTSALSWMVKYKASHPIHSFALQILAHLATHHRLLLTFGHKPGVDNVHADAISRGTHLAPGSPTASLLSQVTCHSRLPTWWPILTHCAAKQSLPTWEQALASLTAVVGAHGNGTPPCGPSP